MATELAALLGITVCVVVCADFLAIVATPVLLGICEAYPSQYPCNSAYYTYEEPTGSFDIVQIPEGEKRAFFVAQRVFPAACAAALFVIMNIRFLVLLLREREAEAAFS